MNSAVTPGKGACEHARVKPVHLQMPQLTRNKQLASIMARLGQPSVCGVATAKRVGSLRHPYTSLLPVALLAHPIPWTVPACGTLLASPLLPLWQSLTCGHVQLAMVCRRTCHMNSNMMSSMIEKSASSRSVMAETPLCRPNQSQKLLHATPKGMHHPTNTSATTPNMPAHAK